MGVTHRHRDDAYFSRTMYEAADEHTVALAAGDIPDLSATYQPLDSDLTAIAALSTTAFGRGLLALADAAALRTSAGLGSIATQAASSVAITGGSVAGIADLAVADGGTGASDASGARSNLGLAIGSDVQAYDADLAAIAALSTTSYGRGLLVLADAAAGRTSLSAQRKTSIDVRDYGATGDGTTDDTAAFQAAVAAAKAAARSAALSHASDQTGGVVIEVPAGIYRVTGKVLGAESMSAKTVGLAFRGAGSAITTIVYDPASAGSLMENDYWLGLRVSGIRFVATITGCTFLASATTHNAQDYQFVDCTWDSFKYGLYLTGNGNNSEFLFLGCQTSEFDDDGAFLYIPSAGASDQFVNYWFLGFKHWSTSSPIVDAAKGGHFHLRDVDASDWGSTLAATGYLFYLRGTGHSRGVCTMVVDGLRAEVKSAYGALLFGEWPQGSVAFRSVDLSSQAGSYSYGNVVTILYENTGGPSYVFDGCVMSGGIEVKYGTNDWGRFHAIDLRSCVWIGKDSPSDVVTHTSMTGVNVQAKPPVRFIACRGSERVSVFDASGAATWDATIGYTGQPLQALERRTLKVSAVRGMPSGSDVPKVILPVGALITGFEALSPAGAVVEGDGGSWTLATTEGTPTTIATATVSGAISSGFDVLDDVSPPFLCDSKAKATLTITPTDVDWGTNDKGLVLIHGYW